MANRKVKNKYQDMVLKVLGTRPIAFNPDLSRMFGSVNAGLFFSQLLYWNEKGRNKEMFYKTVKEIYEETTLTKSQQLLAQKICVSKGVLEVFYKGIPPKRHFKINIGKTMEMLSSFFPKEKVGRSRKDTVLNWQEKQHSNEELLDKKVSEFLPPITETTYRDY